SSTSRASRTDRSTPRTRPGPARRRPTRRSRTPRPVPSLRRGDRPFSFLAALTHPPRGRIYGRMNAQPPSDEELLAATARRHLQPPLVLSPPPSSALCAVGPCHVRVGRDASAPPRPRPPTSRPDRAPVAPCLHPLPPTKPGAPRPCAGRTHSHEHPPHTLSLP